MKKVLPELFIPGPVRVSAATYQAFCSALMGHRSFDFRELYASTQPGLKSLIGTERPIYLYTSSSWGCMEGIVRNLVRTKVLVCCCGAFSDRWYEVALRCGKEAEALRVSWGEVITPKMLESVLEQGGFDTVLIVHSETSTGVMNPIEPLILSVKKFPDVMVAVDVVSSFSAVPLQMDVWGVDVFVSGVQKALALPPGMAVMAVSEAALERSISVGDRGFYFDFIEWEKNARENMTVSTPSIPHVYALAHKMEEIAHEGEMNRFARHLSMQRFAHQWAYENGVSLVAPEGYEAVTLTCFKTPEGVLMPGCVRRMRDEFGYAIDGGYGKFKGKTFRIAHMGNESVESILPVFEAMKTCLFGL